MYATKYPFVFLLENDSFQYYKIFLDIYYIFHNSRVQLGWK